MSTVADSHTSESPPRSGQASLKLACDREQLLHAFQTVAAVAPSRSPKPILQNVKLEATPERVELSATDLEIGIRHTVEGRRGSGSPGRWCCRTARFGLDPPRESTDETLPPRN